MLSLEVELIAILVLATVIGILMGRFLCKNGENEEREKKDKVLHVYKALKSEFEMSQEKIKEQGFMLKSLEEGVAQGEQEIDNRQTRLNSSDKQRTQLLDELKVLEKYKSRFDSLDREFGLQSKTVERLKDEKISHQKEIADFKARGGELESNMVKLNENFKHQGLQHENMLQKTHKKYQFKLEAKERIYEKLEDETSKRYKNTVQLKDKVYEELIVSLNSVEKEYEEFKINYNLDSDRLDSLELEHQKIYHTLETVVLERDDLVARLRAISSVVGAVGIDGSNGDKNQQLLENR